MGNICSSADPDAPSRANPTYREWRHWLVANIPGCDVSKGETIVTYFGAGPPQGTGLHRYIFLGEFDQHWLFVHVWNYFTNYALAIAIATKNMNDKAVTYKSSTHFAIPLTRHGIYYLVIGTRNLADAVPNLAVIVMDLWQYPRQVCPPNDEGVDHSGIRKLRTR